MILAYVSDFVLYNRGVTGQLWLLGSAGCHGADRLFLCKPLQGGLPQPSFAPPPPLLLYTMNVEEKIVNLLK